MLLKILFTIIIFFVLRSFWRSWKFLNVLQAERETAQSQKGRWESSKKANDIVDAEYTVVDE